ncbi:MAG TPA: YXWGXW repeat-containing protein [Bryobacteraceae bacterium]|nr:YXWGXW repeat-containing protein [Bryobacteraceae bacterium]
MKPIMGMAVILGGLSLAGCAGGYAYYASTPPPPLRTEVRIASPGAGFVWIDGYWGYRGGAYAWVPGVWMRPPRPRAVWTPGRWETRRGRYYYRQGRWR